MPLSFPASPTVGDTYTVGTRTWTWDGTIWSMQAATLGVASISTAEIADGAVTTEKIASGAVVEADIASNAVTAAKIASNAVTTEKLGTDVQLGYRNVVINGAMQVHQRGTSTASITTSGYYTADRFQTIAGTLGTWTQSVENDAPTGSGFRKSLKMLCTTADASPASGDQLWLRQIVEGQNMQQFRNGTASAKQFAVTFWVKSNVTGTYVAELWNEDDANRRIVCATYSVSASATWEKKTIIFPADTTGAAFDNDNGGSFEVHFWLAAGSNYTSGTLATTWANRVDTNRAVGQTNLAAATNNYWQITGVQLEAGSVATPFEFEDYGTTLAKCQRYFHRIVNGAEETNEMFAMLQATGAGNAFGISRVGTTMRASPTVSASSAGHFITKGPGGGNITVTGFSFTSLSPRSFAVSITVASGLVAGDASLLLANSASATIDASAEL